MLSKPLAVCQSVGSDLVEENNGEADAELCRDDGETSFGPPVLTDRNKPRKILSFFSFHGCLDLSKNDRRHVNIRKTELQLTFCFLL